jgi:ABC-type transport system involved in cytochrome bd biosynthesis fused ATPase/permease subunit
VLIWPRLLLQLRNAAVSSLDVSISNPSRLPQVCLARVLLKKPSVLFLDEATAALDEKTEEHFQKVLEEKFVDTTIVCIAHRLETLRWCRTRIEMGKGKLLSLTSVPAPVDQAS